MQSCRCSRVCLDFKRILSVTAAAVAACIMNIVRYVFRDTLVMQILMEEQQTKLAASRDEAQQLQEQISSLSRMVMLSAARIRSLSECSRMFDDGKLLTCWCVGASCRAREGSYSPRAERHRTAARRSRRCSADTACRTPVSCTLYTTQIFATRERESPQGAGTAA